MTRLLILIVIGLITFLINISAADSGDRNLVFDSNSLPDDEILRPTLANGNIGFIVYGSTVHLNGVYNGQKGESKRASFPNYANIQLAECSSGLVSAKCNYRLNMKSGIFETTFDGPKQAYSVRHQVYPHRYFDRTIFNHIRIQRLATKDTVRIRIRQIVNSTYPDFVMEKEETIMYKNHKIMVQCGQTTVMESELQKEPHTVCLMHPEIPIEVSCPMDRTAEEHTFITTISHTKEDAYSEMTGILDLLDQISIGTSKANAIRNWQVAEMNRIWEKSGISVEGHDELDRVLKASVFYLTSSLPSINTRKPPIRQFYGLSPSGLGRGTIEDEYLGHNFWDTEMWMMPVVLLMGRSWSRKLLEYRSMMSEAAKNYANETGFAGWRFPWESAFTGVEVTPEACPQCIEYQYHVTGDIAFAARQYFLATQDYTWFQQNGCKLAFETARFWESHLKYNNKTDRYDIKGVMGPDEDHWNVTNNAFTNVLAANNLLFGEFAACECHYNLGLEDDSYKEFVKKANLIEVPYDKKQDFIPQHEGYEIGTKIKQADTVLLGFPLEYPMKNTTKANNLHFYANSTRDNGPAMTWSMYTIGHLDLNEMESAQEMFEKSYSQYIRKPYYTWSETVEGIRGSGNFITGAGGFLQSILYGYAGIRIKIDYLEISNPKLPENVTLLSLPKLSYVNLEFTMKIRQDGWNFTIGSDGNYMKVSVDGDYVAVCRGCSYEVKNIVIISHSNPNPNSKCKLKQLGQKNSSTTIKSHITIISAIQLIFLLNKTYF